jgi:hypothetical protein
MYSCLPNELWIKVIQHTNIITLSKIILLNKECYNGFNNIDYKWELIDNMNDKGICIPLNKETFREYRYCIDFMTLLYNEQHLPDKTIDNLHMEIDFSMLSKYQKLSDNLLYKYHNRILVINNLLSEQVLPYDLLFYYINNCNLNNSHWHYICKFQKLNMEFLEQFIDKIDWHALSENKSILTYDIIYKYHEKLNWHKLCRLGLSEELLDQFKYKFDMFCWNEVAMSSTLSNEFILNNPSLIVNLMGILTCQSLNESTLQFIIENINSLNNDESDIFNKIASRQELSKDFILKYNSLLPLELLIRNPKIKRSYLKQIFG